jgi:hypothetical protein
VITAGVSCYQHGRLQVTGCTQGVKLTNPSGVAFACCVLASLTQGVDPPRPDPVRELRAHVERVTGPEPRDCGQHRLAYAGRSPVLISEEALRGSLSCGTTAAKTRQPFWTFTQGQGIDSWVAHGLLGTEEGTVYSFSFDNAPCGGPGCPSRFLVEPCERPAVTSSPHFGAEFQCKS